MKNTIYVSSFAKLPSGIPSESIYKVLDVGIVIDLDTGLIIDVSVTLHTEVAVNFLKEIIIGFNADDGDVEVLIDEIQKRYHGSAQKAIIVAFRKTIEKYRGLTK